MKLREVIRDLEILHCTVDLETEITGVSYDSRAVKEGELFVAVRGFNADGHRFIPKALEKGAAAVLCEAIPEETGPFVRIADSRLGLAFASSAFYGYPSRQMTMIGITGTSGKTTSSYLIKHLLESRLHAKVGLIGTNGNMIGDTFLHSEFTTPESCELQGLFRKMADAGCTHVVMEVSSHSLSLDRVAGIRYQVGMYTNLTQDHLDFHGDMESYAAAKKLFFSRCDTICVNADDAWAAYMCHGEKTAFLPYGVGKKAALRAEDIRLSAGGVQFAACYGGERVETRLAIPGLFSVYNALGVMGVGLSLGLSLSDCAESMGSSSGVKGRLELLPTDGDYEIVVDYCHKPDALEKVLKTLRPGTRGRLIVLFGCGGDRDKIKRPIMGHIAAQYADLCIVTSDNPRTEEPEEIIREILEGMRDSQTPIQVICDRTEAIAWAIDNVRPGDVILLAGKGHEDYQVVGHEKHHMDEREIVASCLRKRSNA